MKYTIKKLMLPALAGLITLSSCDRGGLGCIRPNGPEITEARTVSDFSNVEVQSSATVYIIEDSAYSFTATGPQNLVENLIVSIRGNQLLVKDRRCVRGSSRLVINIHAPQIGDINLAGSANIYLNKKAASPKTVRFKVSGSGNIITSGKVKTDDLFLSITGSGDIDLETEAVSTHIGITGSGRVYARGSSANCDVDITGSGKSMCADLVVADQYAHISGSGDVWTRADRNLDVDISGSGTVHYYGWPRITSRISGSGKVVHEN